ncbi:MAG: MBL fold metallo-hydrolase [Erysipelotrichaceae bacterium]|nr:MBL fold metallo-hydrolase [Erysipelotrichaceae bacterium]MDY5251246.1 ComEC/Rec2 family competence protein [Erysipelotrichaceae bacterium]
MKHSNIKRSKGYLSFLLIIPILLLSWFGLQKIAPTKPSITPTASTIAPSNDSTFSITYIDVGQADAALVSCDGQYMLIDGGNAPDSNLIYSILQRQGINNLNIIVNSHAHEDHVGGLSGALSYATCDTILAPVTSFDSKAFNNFAQLAAQNHGIQIPQINDEYQLGSAKIKILGLNAKEGNDTSIILKITYGDTAFLFTGDGELAAEQAVLANADDLSADVLKVGHHGSNTSTSPAFLEAIDPTYAIISVGQDNSYGHPHQEVLDRLKAQDITIYRTDIHHDITCTSDGQKVNCAPSQNANQPTNTKQETSQDYILNTNSLKFHLPTCSSIEKIADHNKETFHGTKSQLLKEGYQACKQCNP